MGKKQEQASLVEDLEQELEDTKSALEEANQRAARAARDVDAYAARASARMRSEHAEQQRKRKEAERAAARERVGHIAAGRLPIDGAESVSVTHEGDEVFVDVTVKLTKPEHQAVQDFLNHRDRGTDRIGGARISHSIIDEVSRLAWLPPVIKPGPIFINGGIY